MTKKIKLALLLMIPVLLSGYIGFNLAHTSSTVEYDSTEEVEKAVEETARRYELQLQEREGDLKEIVEQLQHEVIARLQRDESGGEASGGDVLYVNDPQSSLRGECARIGGMRHIECDSWGVMQFKIPTVMWFYSQLYGEEITEKQALMIALDDDKARALASDAIFQIEGAVWHWSAADNDPSYYAYQIPFIRSLMEKIEVGE